MTVSFEINSTESKVEAARLMRGFAAVIAGEAYDQETEEAGSLETPETTTKKAPAKKSSAKKESATDELSNAAKPIEDNLAKKISMDDLRAIASDILENESDSIADEFAELLGKYGAAKLSKLDEQHFDAILPELKKLQKKANL